MAIGYIAVGLPLVLVLGENLRDAWLPDAGAVDRAFIEASISAYFHTGMREVFVGSLCAIGVFLVCYKGYQQWDNLAAYVAGFSVLLVALFPTPEASREAADTGVPAPDSVTIFSSASLPDPAWVGYVHFIAAAVFFATLAAMALLLFTKTDQLVPTHRKQWRNRVYRITGVLILVCVTVIAVLKLFVDAAWVRESSLVFVFEAIAVVAFGIAWLTKAEVVLPDREEGNPGRVRSAAS